MAEHIKTTGLTRVAIVYSDEGAGREGNQLATDAMDKVGLKPVASIGFKPGEGKKAVDMLAKADAQAVILTSLAGPGAEFFREFIKLPNRPQVFTWSIMVVEQIYKDVGDKIYGLVVSQIVPSPADRSFGVVREYQELLKKAKLEDGGYSGLEAYIAARILVEGLKRAGKAPTRAGLIAALEGMKGYDLGGDIVSFTAEDHVGRRFVELTIVGRDGRFLR
jgi:ABC-type branched-subunit amino acid transport system substrate-binding protein